jgi:hypothetical protein
VCKQGYMPEDGLGDGVKKIPLPHKVYRDFDHLVLDHVCFRGMLLRCFT